MLERDRRRNARAAYASKLARRRWLETSDKWAKCPNHGVTAKRDELVRASDEVEPLEITHGGTTMVCYECKSKWHVHAHLMHP